jgi:GNAT superfamily N-acetyltransferase
MLVREYVPADAADLRRCVVELQEFERTLEPRLRPGEVMADEYCQLIHERCRRWQGTIFVAEVDGCVVGFVAVVARQPFTEPDDPPGTYALVTDLAVSPPFRQQGIGRRLLEHAEAFARAKHATELRIAVLAGNPARRLYEAVGFATYLDVMAKPL